MSRRPPKHVEQRVRELARQHPGWTPSQMAIFLQGERLKVTSEDVRRVLARPAPTGDDEPAETADRPRYTAPREERQRSALPIGLLFGILFFLVSVAGGALVAEYRSDAGPFASFAVNLLVLFVAGVVASHRFASGARAGMIAGGFGWLLTVGVGLLLYYTLNSLYASLALNLPAPNNRDALYSLLGGSAIRLFGSSLIGLCLGWLGAKLFGRRRRRAAFS